MQPEPGTVLDSGPLPAALWPAHAAAATRVTYQGVGYDGAGREVTGSVYLPGGDAPPGGWPVVSFAHGTTGLADNCAPSVVGLTRLEREHVARWLAAGYVVAATDYEGLSTPGPHPYFNGEAVADDVIDIVRAARGLDGRVGRTWLVAGFSQGGHAALFVGLVASRYASELDFRGTVALAPPVHLPLLLAVLTARGEGATSIFPPFLLAGLRTSYPDFDARPFLTDAGGRLVEAAATATLGEMFRATAALTNDDTGITHIDARPGIEPILEACRVPVTRMDRPVFIGAGTADEIVPLEVAERFVADLRAAGTPVRFDRHDGATHAGTLSAGHDALIAWTGDLLAGGDPPVAARARFSPFDADGDGRLTRDDYEVFALRLVQAYGVPPGSPAALAVRDGYRALWRAVADRADTDADGSVGPAEFLRWIGTAAGDDGFAAELRPLAEAVIGLADGDRDGVLEQAEFVGLLAACGLRDDGVLAEIAAFDTDRDGVVTAAEIVAVVRDFCLTPAPGTPGSWLFGRF
jgi:acetyl esterase/lipase